MANLKICLECGKEFIPRVQNQLLCSPECRIKRRKRQQHEYHTNLPKNCPICGTPLYNGLKYCSAECRERAKDAMDGQEYPCDKCGADCDSWCLEWKNWFKRAWKNCTQTISASHRTYYNKRQKPLKIGTIQEIVDMARAEGMSYGEYVGERYKEAER